MKRVSYLAQRIFPVVMCSCLQIITVATIIYMAKDNVYSNKLFAYFSITPRLHAYFMNLPVNKEVLLRLINLSSISFYCTGIIFPIVLSADRAKKYSTYIVYILFALFFIQAVLLDPSIVKCIYMKKWAIHIDVLVFRAFYQSFLTFFHVFNKSALAVGFVLLLRLYIYSPKIPHIRLNIAAMSIGMFLLETVYIYMFGWAPVQQLWMSRVANYTLYKPLPIGKPGLVFNYYPYITIGILILFGAGLYRYLYIKKRINLMDWEFSRKVDMAETTVRALCHFTKNELLAIQSEVEQLQAVVESGQPDCGRYFADIYEICDLAYDRLNEAHRMTGFRRVSLSPLSLCKLLDTVIEPYKSQKEVTINLSLPENDVIIMGEELYLKEAVNNLVRNAIEAFGNYSIEQKALDISCSVNKAWAVIIIKDNGPGIPEKNLVSIFEPFFSTKPLTTNWGIGLALCKRIILMHKGKLEADSSHQGTTFTIALPCISEN